MFGRERAVRLTVPGYQATREEKEQEEVVACDGNKACKNRVAYNIVLHTGTRTLLIMLLRGRRSYY
ncbi:hypothetical protein KSC_073820 [Ktedonobacter sp. SOSP1-52]|nr:hypothetical protein KSC_073820 [Ktedonobacter sp. SOSP1-52]